MNGLDLEKQGIGLELFKGLRFFLIKWVIKLRKSTTTKIKNKGADRKKRKVVVN